MGPGRAPRRTPRLHAGTALGLTLALAFAAPSRADDAAREFNAATNLAGARWTYGWSATLGAPMTLYTARVDTNLIQHWRANPNHLSYVSYNPTAGPRTMPNAVTIPGGGLSLNPGHTQHAIVRWTAPVAGAVRVRARFIARSTNNTERTVAVLHGAQVLYNQWVLPAVHGAVVTMTSAVAVQAGETVDFVVGSADGSNFADVTGLDATINYEPEPTLLGPVLHFGRDRFVAARWPGDAFESIAFDPVSRQIAGMGKIQTLCGAFVSNGPPGEKGLAWDPVTQTIWEVTNNRTVRRWNGATLLDTVFTVPLTFTLPGGSPDTMESVRGIALDSTYVYFVDAGPDPGQIASNAWFKFTRAGVPVSSSRGTDFTQHLDMDPDALVDDIVYVPFSSPVFPGMLLIALEHSGIQVLDTAGRTVDRFRWSGQKLLPRDASRQWGRLSAFAGIAVDPLTGNLYLQDNDTGDAQVWVRLPRNESATFAVAIGGPQAWLYAPQAGCSMALWNAVPAYAGNVFGLAYRPADRSLYTVDFGSGDLWRVDPRSGFGVRLGPTGVTNVWGVAVDPENDVLYVSAETASGNRILRVDPATGAAAPLPNLVGRSFTDLAYSTADDALYGIEGGAPSRLLRMDPVTGIGTEVATTVFARGLDYDPYADRLIGIASGQLVSIHPATGASTVLAALEPGPFEGLAVVTVPFDPAVLDAPGSPPAVPHAPRVWPNPAPGAVLVRFDVERQARIAVTVFDVQGRRVRGLADRNAAPGAHTVAWDGTTDGGGKAAAGVYFVRVESEGHAAVARVVRVR